MSMTLSIHSMPSMRSCSPTECVAASSPSVSVSALDLPTVSNASFRMSLTSELFPEPLTPVTQTNNPSGISTVTFFRLLCFAPTIRKTPAFGLRRSFGIAISFAPVRYCPVGLFGLSKTSCGVPAATICPPRIPGPGPKSTR